jgi:general secretion pathway protein C
MIMVAGFRQGAQMQVLVRRAAVSLVWLCVGLTVAFWLSRWANWAGAAPAAAVASSGDAVVSPPDATDLAAALRGPAGVASAAAPVVAAGQSLSLVGIVRSARAADSVALISVDAQAPKPYRVGAEVTSGAVVQSITAREVALGAARNAPTAQTLSVPKRP